MKKEQTKVMRVPESVYEFWDFLEKYTGKSKVENQKELCGVLTQLCARHDTNKFNLVFEYSLFPEACVKITTEGLSSFVIGQVPESEMERKERFQDVALSIAEVNGKSVKVTENKCGLVNCGMHPQKKEE
ncbi:MAG: hypothetical protein ABSA75_04285 [Candidatus Bathyarchaeia archaeon]